MYFLQAVLGFGIGLVFRLGSVPLNRLWGTIVAAVPVAVWIVLLVRSPGSAPVLWAGTGLMIAVLVTRPLEWWWQRHRPASESKG